MADEQQQNTEQLDVTQIGGAQNGKPKRLKAIWDKHKGKLGIGVATVVLLGGGIGIGVAATDGGSSAQHQNTHVTHHKTPSHTKKTKNQDAKLFKEDNRKERLLTLAERKENKDITSLNREIARDQKQEGTQTARIGRLQVKEQSQQARQATSKHPAQLAAKEQQENADIARLQQAIVTEGQQITQKTVKVTQLTTEVQQQQALHAQLRQQQSALVPKA